MRLQQKHITLQIQCDFQKFFLIAHNSKIFLVNKGAHRNDVPLFF